MQKAEGSTQKGVGIPRSAYIHVPFCRHRCGYCNFTLVAGRDDLIEPFLVALEKELSWLGGAREVDTLFLGGGTPTHLRGEQLERLLAIVLKWHPIAENSKIETRNSKQIRSTKSERQQASEPCTHELPDADSLSVGE